MYLPDIVNKRLSSHNSQSYITVSRPTGNPEPIHLPKSVLQSIIRLKGPKSIETVENRLRATLIVRNDSSILQNLRIERDMQGKFLLNNLNVGNFARMDENGWNILGLEKKEVLIN